MATEFEHLRLSITLIDDAAAGIKALRRGVRDAEREAREYQRMVQANTKNAAVFRDVVGHVEGKYVLLGGSVGFLRSKMEGIGRSFEKQGPEITAFARQQQQANQAASLLGITIGELKGLRSQAESGGLSRDVADQIISSMTALRHKLSYVGGRTEFQEMLRRSGFRSDPGVFQQYTERLSKATSYREQYKEIQRARKELERYAIEKEGMDPELAKEMGIKWLALHGLPAEARLIEEINEVTAEYQARQQLLADRTEAWLKEVVQLNQNVRSIGNQLAAAALRPDSPFYAALKGVVTTTKFMADNAEKWIAVWLFVTAPHLLIPFLAPGLKWPGWDPRKWNWNPFKWRFKLMSDEIGDLTEHLHQINFIMSPTGPRILPAAFAGADAGTGYSGTQGMPGWLQTPGGGGRLPPTPGTGTGGTPGTGTGGTPGTPSGQPTITPQPPLPPGVLYNPITSSKFIGGVGGTSASMGAGRHQGEDWAAPIGTPVHAVRDGVIVRVGTDNFGTPAVTIDHGDGTFTRDLHLQPGSVPPVGTKVYGGQPYARSGTANGVPHLHHERWLGQPGRQGSRIISPTEESGRDRKQPMIGGELAPKSAQPGVARAPAAAAPTMPTTPAEPEPPEKPAWPRTLPTHPSKQDQPSAQPSAWSPETPYEYGAESHRSWYANLDFEPGLTPFTKEQMRPYFDPRQSDVNRQYGESALKPGSKGWHDYIDFQIDRAAKSGKGFIEFDNADFAFKRDPDAVKAAYAKAASRGLQVLLKNPTADQIKDLAAAKTPDGRYIVGGAVFEQGALSPREFAAAREAAGRPELPGTFVRHGTQPVPDVSRTPFTTAQRGPKEYSGMSIVGRGPTPSKPTSITPPSDDPEFKKPGGYTPIDRKFLNQSLGNEIRTKVKGDAKVSVDVKEPDKTGDEPKALFKKETVERQETMGDDADRGPSVEVD